MRKIPYALGQNIGIEQVQSSHRGYFFSEGAMRAFKSRVDYMVYPGSDGWYFVTSERFGGPRVYTVRRLTEYGDIVNRSEAGQYATLRAARKAAERAAHQEES